MPKSVGAQIPVKEEIWWFLESRGEKTKTQFTQIAIKL